MKTYMGLIIERCASNSSGMRWCAMGRNGYLRSNTLAGIKALIRRDAQ